MACSGTDFTQDKALVYVETRAVQNNEDVRQTIRVLPFYFISF
jgi:hypothetical protein